MAIQTLVGLAPKMATVLRDGQEVEIPVEEIEYIYEYVKNDG